MGRERERDGDACLSFYYAVCHTMLRGAPPRDDAGQFDANWIRTNKRLAYETGSERRLRGQRRVEIALQSSGKGLWSSWMHPESRNLGISRFEVK